MKIIKEHFNASGDPIVLVYSFYSDTLTYMVDILGSDSGSLMFDNKRNALDYAQAMTNKINRTNNTH